MSKRLNGASAKHMKLRRLPEMTEAETLAAMRKALGALLTDPEGKPLPIMTFPPDQVVHIDCMASELQAVFRLMRREDFKR